MAFLFSKAKWAISRKKIYLQVDTVAIILVIGLTPEYWPELSVAFGYTRTDSHSKIGPVFGGQASSSLRPLARIVKWCKTVLDCADEVFRRQSD